MRLDLTGERFGRLVVLRKVGRQHGSIVWRCLCSCGNECGVAVESLRRGATQSCGCLRHERGLDLTGQKFGQLTVLHDAGRRSGRVAWHCVCSCGTKCIVTADHLRRGKTRSCGCGHGPSPRHGQSKKKAKTYIYKTWEDMIQRCTNSNHRQFKNYGSRGIKIHDPWRFGENGKGGFECFFVYVLEHLGERRLGMSLDRIDNDGNYEPGNIRWATQSMQVTNSRRGKNRSGYLFVSETPDTAAVVGSCTSGGAARRFVCNTLDVFHTEVGL